MEKIENEASVWDNIWDNGYSLDIAAIKKSIETTKKSQNWLEYTAIVNKKFDGWQNVKSIEIGSGMGWHSLLAATEGAEITLLDYSKPALKLAEERLELLSIKANYIFGNAFELIKNNDKEYNLSWSFGTVEHFKNELRQQFFQLHFDYLIKGGITIISAPHKYAINYRLWMHYAKKYKEWTYGLEIPYSKKEYIKRLKTSKNKLIKIVYNKGRPCFNKLMKMLKRHSKVSYSLFYLPIKVNKKIQFKISPFYYRSIILIAEKLN